MTRASDIAAVLLAGFKTRAADVAICILAPIVAVIFIVCLKEFLS